MGSMLGEQYKKKVVLTDDFVRTLVGEGLNDFIVSRGWPAAEEYVKIIKTGTIDDESLLKLIESLRYLRDSRTAEEYACDLILGWAIEDAVVLVLSSYTRIVRCSADRERVFLQRTNTKPDLIVQTADNEYTPIEIVVDFTGYWLREGRLHIRHEKYEEMKKSRCLIIGFDLLNKKFFIFEAGWPPEKVIDSHTPYGGKKVYCIDLKNIPFYDISDFKEIMRDVFCGA